MTKRTLAVLAMGAAAGALPAAQGATLSYSAAEAMATTNWTDVLGFSKFDTSLGTLTSIRFDLTGVVQGIGNAAARQRREPGRVAHLGDTEPGIGARPDPAGPQHARAGQSGLQPEFRFDGV